MEVESTNAGASDASKKGSENETRENRTLLWVLGGLGILIVGLIIAIVVVKNLPQGDEVDAKVSDADMEEYYSIYDEVWSNIVENNSEMNGDEILALYEEKIAETTDEEVKLMLIMDYYGFVIMYDTEGAREDEVRNEMLSADAKLQTPLSASNIISMAISYNDNELEEKYNIILNERIAEMGEQDMENDVRNADDEDSDDDSSNEGVGRIVYEEAVF